MEDTDYNTEALAKVRKLMLYLEEQNIAVTSDFYLAPEDESTFCMADIMSQKGCGTAACAAGWAYLAGIVESDSGIMRKLTFRFGGGSAVDWLFGGAWSEDAPRPIDVVRRIDHLITSDPEFLTSNWRITWSMIQQNDVESCPEALVTDWEIPQSFKDKYFSKD